MLPKFLQITTNLDFIYSSEISRISNFLIVIRVLNELRNIPCKHSSWRHLEDIFHFRLQKTSSRRFQDVLIKTNVFALPIRLQQMFPRQLQVVLIKTNKLVLVIRLEESSRRFKNVFKSSWRRLAKTTSTHPEDVFKIFQDVFKTSSRRAAKTSSRDFQNVLKKSCKIVYKTSSRHLQDVLNTSSVTRRLQCICKSHKRFSSFSFSLQ